MLSSDVSSAVAAAGHGPFVSLGFQPFGQSKPFRTFYLKAGEENHTNLATKCFAEPCAGGSPIQGLSLSVRVLLVSVGRSFVVMGIKCPGRGSAANLRITTLDLVCRRVRVFPARHFLSFGG